MLGFVQSVVLGVIAAVVGSFLQYRKWRHDYLIQLRDQEFAEARATVEEIARIIDRRLTAQGLFSSLVQNGNASVDDVAVYRETLQLWMGNFSVVKSRLLHTFGDDEVRFFEYRLHYLLKQASDGFVLRNKHGYVNLSTKDKSLSSNAEEAFMLARREAYNFLNQLNSKVRDDQFGRTKLVNDVYAGDPRLISRTYLIRRLFALVL